jgi:formamidopyrimidine-DNA glycosylase
MPELPEVETIARKLRRSIVGKRIVRVELSGLSLRKPIADGFAAGLPGRIVRKIHRRGKYLITELEPRGFCLMHLGMSGRICYGSACGEAVKHTHATIWFADGTQLQFRDPRRFGLLALYELERLAEIPELGNLGKDPLSASFDAAWLWSRLRAGRREIKSFLLDQREIAGIGNIYACEALFAARVHPERRCFTVKRHEAGRLVSAIRGVLRAAIRHRGTSFSDFIDSDGELGAHQEYLRVFQREGKRCVRCNSSNICRLHQGNRSSFYCARCQR